MKSDTGAGTPVALGCRSKSPDTSSCDDGMYCRCRRRVPSCCTLSDESVGSAPKNSLMKVSGVVSIPRSAVCHGKVGDSKRSAV